MRSNNAMVSRLARLVANRSLKKIASGDWKYIKPLQDADAVKDFEQEAGTTLPSDLKALVGKYNGGRPARHTYDTATERGKVFKTLLSFNRGDAENVYKYRDVDTKNKDMIPIASDPAGNLFVLKGGKVYLWNHETDETTFLANSVSDLLAGMR